MAREKEETLVIPSSGNVYADLGAPDAEEMLAKAKLVRAIGHTIRDRKLTQGAAAKLIGIDQPKLSDLLGGQFREYSSDRLMHFLTLLGQDVAIFIAPKAGVEKGPGQVSVSLAHGL